MTTYLLSSTKGAPDVLDLSGGTFRKVFDETPDMCLIFTTGEPVNLYINLTCGGVMKTASLSTKQRCVIWETADLRDTEKNVVLEISLKAQRRSTITPQEVNVNGTAEKPKPKPKTPKKETTKKETPQKTPQKTAQKAETLVTPEVSDNEVDSLTVLKTPTKTSEEKARKKPAAKPGRKRNASTNAQSNGAKKVKNTESVKSEVKSSDKTDTNDNNKTEGTSDTGLFSVQKISNDTGPSLRWGTTLTSVDGGQAYLIGGQCGERFPQDSCWKLDVSHPDQSELKWSRVETEHEGATPEARVGHTATYDQSLRCIYIYGGSKRNKWFSDVHVLDLDSNSWKLSKVDGDSPVRAYHSSCLFRHELWVFGGVYPNPDPEPDGCSNDVHIYSPSGENWYKPIVTGDKPVARSGQSATLLGDQMVVFGGWDSPELCFNDVYILDLSFVEWSQPNLIGTAPTRRSWHTACALSDRRIFIHGGYDGDDALNDCFILDLSTNCWEPLGSCDVVSPRTGHVSLLSRDEDDESRERVLVFGGGDNERTWFNDLFLLSINNSS